VGPAHTSSSSGMLVHTASSARSLGAGWHSVIRFTLHRRAEVFECHRAPGDLPGVASSRERPRPCSDQNWRVQPSSIKMARCCCSSSVVGIRAAHQMRLPTDLRADMRMR
jgi:hypothetical protein